MLAAVALVIVLSPLPLGSADPWALAVLETAVFALVIGEAGSAVYKRKIQVDAASGTLALPIILFLGVVLFQLAPLPPGLLRIVSPATYRLYSVSLAGWPTSDYYAGAALRNASLVRNTTEVNPTVGSPPSGSGSARRRPAVKRGGRLDVVSRWRGISVAPAMTGKALLKAAAFAAWFFLIVLWSSGDSGDAGEKRIQRVVVSAVLFSGLLVAAVGIIELFAWNGKILWMFRPYDWFGQLPSAIARACGPFVNPDHFGDYLAMVLPLAVAGAVFDLDLFAARSKVSFRLLSATIGFVVAVALLLSGSRGAWIGATLGLALMVWLSGWLSAADSRDAAARGRRRLIGAGVAFAAVVVLALAFVGPVGRAAVSTRVQGAPLGERTRLGLSLDSLRMVRDRPLFGVGLGAWPEVFPHYHSPPWSPEFFRETHNDYMQLLTETGLAGFIAIVWFGIAAVVLIRRRFVSGLHGTSPLLIAICGSLVAIGVHEFVDFSFQTPANAILAIVLLALAIRIVREKSWATKASAKVGLCAAGTIAAAGVLMVCALSQSKVPYPYGPLITTPTQAIAAINAHPAEGAPHMALSVLLGGAAPLKFRVNELRRAAWLDPFNPYVNDSYAALLMESGHQAAGLKVLTRSVEDSPSLGTHRYFLRHVHSLGSKESSAIEDGLKAARARGYEGAAVDLAEYYSVRGQYDAAAEAYVYAARRQTETSARVACLISAGVAYAREQQFDDASAVLHRAITAEPRDADAYDTLIGLVLGPEGQLKAALSLLSEGIRAGADPESLYQALADAASADRDPKLAEWSLGRAAALHPRYSLLCELAQVYAGDKKYDRAIRVLRRAIEIKPDVGEAYFDLGLAEERNYELVSAERDLSRAVALAPSNTGYRNYYRQFESRLTAAARRQAPP